MDGRPIDEVLIVDYDPTWPRSFQMERSVLIDAFDDPTIVIEHIGSTAVPGLCAKPIIDIMIGVEGLMPVDDYIRVMAPLGYINVPQDQEGRYFFYKGMPRTHHVHITQYGGEEWGRHLAFRDILRRDPSVRARYAELKRGNARIHRLDRQAYVDSKTEFIREIEKSR